MPFTSAELVERFPAGSHDEVRFLKAIKDAQVFYGGKLSGHEIEIAFVRKAVPDALEHVSDEAVRNAFRDLGVLKSSMTESEDFRKDFDRAAVAVQRKLGPLNGTKRELLSVRQGFPDRLREWTDVNILQELAQVPDLDSKGIVKKLFAVAAKEISEKEMGDEMQRVQLARGFFLDGLELWTEAEILQALDQEMAMEMSFEPVSVALTKHPVKLASGGSTSSTFYKSETKLQEAKRRQTARENENALAKKKLEERKAMNANQNQHSSTSLKTRTGTTSQGNKAGKNLKKTSSSPDSGHHRTMGPPPFLERPLTKAELLKKLDKEEEERLWNFDIVNRYDANQWNGPGTSADKLDLLAPQPRLMKDGVDYTAQESQARQKCHASINEWVAIRAPPNVEEAPLHNLSLSRELLQTQEFIEGNADHHDGNRNDDRNQLHDQDDISSEQMRRIQKRREDLLAARDRAATLQKDILEQKRAAARKMAVLGQKPDSRAHFIDRRAQELLAGRLGAAQSLEGQEQQPMNQLRYSSPLTTGRSSATTGMMNTMPIEGSIFLQNLEKRQASATGAEPPKPPRSVDMDEELMHVKYQSTLQDEATFMGFSPPDRLTGTLNTAASSSEQDDKGIREKPLARQFLASYAGILGNSPPQPARDLVRGVQQNQRRSSVSRQSRASVEALRDMRSGRDSAVVEDALLAVRKSVQQNIQQAAAMNSLGSPADAGAEGVLFFGTTGARESNSRPSAATSSSSTKKRKSTSIVEQFWRPTGDATGDEDDELGFGLNVDGGEINPQKSIFEEVVCVPEVVVRGTVEEAKRTSIKLFLNRGAEAEVEQKQNIRMSEKNDPRKSTVGTFRQGSTRETDDKEVKEKKSIINSINGDNVNRRASAASIGGASVARTTNTVVRGVGGVGDPQRNIPDSRDTGVETQDFISFNNDIQVQLQVPAQQPRDQRKKSTLSPRTTTPSPAERGTSPRITFDTAAQSMRAYSITRTSVEHSGKRMHATERRWTSFAPASSLGEDSLRDSTDTRTTKQEQHSVYPQVDPLQPLDDMFLSLVPTSPSTVGGNSMEALEAQLFAEDENEGTTSITDEVSLVTLIERLYTMAYITRTPSTSTTRGLESEERTRSPVTQADFATLVGLSMRFALEFAAKADSDARSWKKRRSYLDLVVDYAEILLDDNGHPVLLKRDNLPFFLAYMNEYLDFFGSFWAEVVRHNVAASGGQGGQDIFELSDGTLLRRDPQSTVFYYDPSTTSSNSKKEPNAAAINTGERHLLAPIVRDDSITLTVIQNLDSNARGFVLFEELADYVVSRRMQDVGGVKSSPERGLSSSPERGLSRSRSPERGQSQSASPDPAERGQIETSPVVPGAGSDVVQQQSSHVKTAEPEARTQIEEQNLLIAEIATTPFPLPNPRLDATEAGPQVSSSRALDTRTTTQYIPAAPAREASSSKESMSTSRMSKNYILGASTQDGHGGQSPEATQSGDPSPPAPATATESEVGDSTTTTTGGRTTITRDSTNQRASADAGSGVSRNSTSSSPTTSRNSTSKGVRRKRSTKRLSSTGDLRLVSYGEQLEVTDNEMEAVDIGSFLQHSASENEKENEAVPVDDQKENGSGVVAVDDQERQKQTPVQLQELDAEPQAMKQPTSPSTPGFGSSEGAFVDRRGNASSRTGAGEQPAQGPQGVQEQEEPRFSGKVTWTEIAAALPHQIEQHQNGDTSLFRFLRDTASSSRDSLHLEMSHFQTKTSPSSSSTSDIVPDRLWAWILGRQDLLEDSRKQGEQSSNSSGASTSSSTLTGLANAIPLGMHSLEHAFVYANELEPNPTQMSETSFFHFLMYLLDFSQLFVIFLGEESMHSNILKKPKSTRTSFSSTSPASENQLLSLDSDFEVRTITLELYHQKLGPPLIAWGLPEEKLAVDAHTVEFFSKGLVEYPDFADWAIRRAGEQDVEIH
ncbi:unnamed protein product [Amoebophrya sp. A25]|nr:unnamed protein product [Amoebophrya sp. A25]|eukprot:GSA25T00010169001.1